MNNNLINNYITRLEDKENEDLDLIKIINNFFIKKRGYSIKMPREGTAVAACMSGGQDSTATIAILLHFFHLKIYPFFINRGQSNYIYEKQSVDYYNKLFKERFSDLYNNVLEIEVQSPGSSYKKLLTEELKNNHIGYPARNTIIFLSGSEYAYSLKSQGININTVFGATVSSDGLYHSSLTWTRVTNLAICQFLNDYSWQLISLAIEKELGNSYDKDVLIKYCTEIVGIPLEFTRTCTEKSSIQCGECICCYDRRRCFKEAGIDDKTEYLYHPFPKRPNH